ncbi:LCP family protein [Paenibacillus sp. 453mf]|uniref:LCP family glycopolymer transferase n=1 Tax=Paenibacillus sp. 453mf TaxID=1761874 RepID=UPI0008E8F514|nr:LCP family protein [Paenibacillus sp. 453mf]SFS39020.1 cell envelope-related function transcriptional attenuator common domain-containing protein [Paenibacillus sp. 453mf]
MKRWLKITISTASLFIVLGVGYGWYLYKTVQSTADEIYEPREPSVAVTYIEGGQQSSQNQPAEKIKKEESFSVLLLGVDERQNDVGRSDTLVLLTVNPADKSILMFNIPRDTRTEIVGKGYEDKINHAYAFGGVNMSIQTVEKFLDNSIDYYVKLNMEGFTEIIDLLGGVEVNNPFEFNIDGVVFEEGIIRLMGEEALLYSRMRYDDPRGDLGRNSRQQEIIKQLMKNALQISSVTKIQSILNEVGSNVKTDITFDDMKKFLTDYSRNLGNIETVEIQGRGEKMNGIYYYIVDEQERSRIHELMKKHLQKDQQH